MMRGNVVQRGERVMGEETDSAQKGLGEVAQKWTELDISGDLANVILKDLDGSNGVTSDDAFKAVTQLFCDFEEFFPKMHERDDWSQKGAFEYWWEFKIDREAGENADCDNLDELRRLYKLLWYSPADKSDTMNTVKTTFNQAKKEPVNVDEKEGASKTWDKLVGVGLDAPFALLCYLTHTMGDFIPCWGNFNAGRYASTQDYWDLTLLCVQNWYLHHQQYSETYAYENPLDEGVLTGCHVWLDSFGSGLVGWKAFVDENYLQDWVDEGYHVVPLFLGHCFEHKWPQRSSEIRECLLNMSARIIARGLRMRKKLLDDGVSEDDWKLSRKDRDTRKAMANQPSDGEVIAEQ